MKELQPFIIIAIATIVGCYFVGAFLSMKFHPLQWGFNGRCTYVVMSFILTILFCSMYHENTTKR